MLIDADNAQPSIANELLAEVARYGTAHVKRAYGDWTGTSLKGWKDRLLAQSIQPVQQFAYTTGKNATDSAMIIDAMDLLYSGRFDGFCLVSSDSDFTRLASRLRESGLTVYGFGERKTPKAFVAACDKFIYIENLRKASRRPRGRGGRNRARGRAEVLGHCAQAGRRADAAAQGRGRGGLGRGWLGGARIRRHAHHQAAAGLRLAQLRIQQADGPDDGHHPVRPGASHF